MGEIFDTPIVAKTYVHVPRKKVYETLTTAKGWDSWFTTGGMTLDLKIGGIIKFRWKDWGPNKETAEDVGKVIAFEENERFIFSWHPLGNSSDGTTVEITLSDQGTGTQIQLTEKGYPNSVSGKKWCLDCAVGWGEALTLLKFYLESGLTYKQPD